MQYRRDIDGLRAIAVVPVVLFHAGFKPFQGGYIGVDIFFVISGYLIARIIIDELEQDRFSILRFYERRANRILPALYTVILLIIPFAWLYMLPDPMENFGQSIVATIFFSNNILLTLTSTYWDLSAEFKPLLHTWSLAVEEQFYFIFPLLLMLIHMTFKKHLVLILSILLVASLAISVWSAQNIPRAGFYLLPFRAWELLAGSLCTLAQRRVSSLRWRTFLPSFGLLLIGFSLIILDKAAPFAPVYTLIPVLGAVLIIVFGQFDTTARKLLEHKVTVGIGLISYSIYLWHQPLFAFLRIYSKTEPSTLQYNLVIGTTLIFSFITWKYVEAPFRYSRFSKLKILCFVALFLSAVGIVFHAQHGFPSRMHTKTEVTSADMYISYNERVYAYKKDTFLTSDKVRILVLGNSFSRDFINMMTENLPLETLEILYRDDVVGCLNRTPEAVLSHLIDQSDVVVFASGEWQEACRSDLGFLEALGKKVFYVGTKHFGYNLNWLKRVSLLERTTATNPVPQDIIQLNTMIQNAVPPENYIGIIDKISDADGDIWLTDAQGNLLSGDRIHLTRQGAIFVGFYVLDNPAFLKALGLSKEDH